MTHPIPIEAMDGKIGVLGITGSGKTFTAIGMIEQLLDLGRQVIMIDPTGAYHGIRTAFPIPIFGGTNGDVPITDQDGEAIAKIIIERNLSAIVDVSLLLKESHASARRFMAKFVATLKNSPPRARYLVIDEADEFMPENVGGGDSHLFGDLKWIVRRGRNEGWRVMMVTQRPQDIAKSVLTQCETMVIHTLVAPQDRKAIEEWVKGNAEAGQAKEVLGSLARLQTGEAWIWSPRRNLLLRAQLPANRSADSSRTPEAGDELAALDRLLPADIEAIRAALLPVPDHVVDATDMVEAPGQEREWSALIADRDEFEKRATIAEQDRDAFERRALAAEDLLAGMVSATRLFEDAWREAGEMWGYVDVHVHGADAHLEANGWTKPGERDIDAETGCADDQTFAATPVAVIRAAAELIAKQVEVPFPPTEGAVGYRVIKTSGAGANGTSKVGAPKAAIEMIDLLDRVNPAKLTWAQVAQMTGRAATGGSFNTARKWMLASGLILVDGEFIRSAQPDPIGMTRESALRLWKSVLVGVAPRMIAALEHGPQTVADLAKNLGAAPRGGSWNSGLAQLRRNGVAELRGDRWHLMRPLPGEAP